MQTKDVFYIKQLKENLISGNISTCLRVSWTLKKNGLTSVITNLEEIHLKKCDVLFCFKFTKNWN